MAKIFCENCGQQRRAVVAVGKWGDVPLCDVCKRTDGIADKDFTYFDGHGSVSDAKPRFVVAPPEAMVTGAGGGTPVFPGAVAKGRCIDCGTVLRVHYGKPARLQCRKCEKKSQKPAPLSTKNYRGSPLAVATPAARVIARTVLGGRESAASLNLLSDDDYQSLRPHAEHNDLARKLLAQIGMIVAVHGPQQGRLKLDTTKGDTSRNLACRIRRLLRNEKVAAEVESFVKASCVVVSVGYGKRGK